MQASRVKGSARQLFGREEGNSDEFEIRPSASRKIDGMATLLGDLHEFAHDIISRNIDGEVTIPKVVYNESIDAVNEFQQQYMGTCGGTQCPCLLTGSTIRADWPAGELRWSPKTLLQSIGGSTRVEMKGANATVTFEAFVAYMKSSECADDDDPCYLWETLDENDQIHFFLISKFIVPRHFRGEDEELVHGCHVPGDTTDLLSFAGEDGLMFGLHRWLLIGSKRSGSSLHIDPLFSSAWNTLLLGTKLWCIIPPSPHAERLILEVMELVNPCNKEVRYHNLLLQMDQPNRHPLLSRCMLHGGLLLYYHHCQQHMFRILIKPYSRMVRWTNYN